MGQALSGADGGDLHGGRDPSEHGWGDRVRQCAIQGKAVVGDDLAPPRVGGRLGQGAEEVCRRHHAGDEGSAHQGATADHRRQSGRADRERRKSGYRLNHDLNMVAGRTKEVNTS